MLSNIVQACMPYLSTYCPCAKNFTAKATKEGIRRFSADALFDCCICWAQEHHHVMDMCTILWGNVRLYLQENKLVVVEIMRVYQPTLYM